MPPYGITQVFRTESHPMVIYTYTLPAILAFLSKIVILVLSLRAERRNFQTRLFVVAVTLSMLVNIVEIAGLQKLLAADQALVLHYVAHIMMLAVIAHLAVLISFDKFSVVEFSKIGIAIYSYVLLLEILLMFTPWVVAGVEPIGGYTYTRIPGFLYWTYELFIIVTMCSITLLPTWGLRNGQDATTRNRCKIWLALSTPLAVLILTILSLLHLGFRWINASVTAPLFVAALLAAIGYAVHHSRPIDLNFYLPWSRVKKSKAQLYDQLATFNRDISHFRTVDGLLEQLAMVLRCPVALVNQRAVLHDTSKNSKLSGFPISVLHGLRGMTVANEIREHDPRLHALMALHGIAVIVPFFPHSNIARHWLLLGKPFSRLIYMSRDFREIERLFGRIAGQLLDKLMRTDIRIIQPSKVPAGELKKRLSESVADFEAALIRRALMSCHGNKACAARLLGIQPNTLHYKIERYGISPQPAT